jgi:RAD51-like protein 2
MSSIRTIQSLPLAQIIIELLLSKGFCSVQDLSDIQPIDLSTELGITPSAALEIVKSARQSLYGASDNAVEKGSASVPMTAKDLLLKFSSKSRPIITFCKSLDTVLGGGVPIGQITEFCGVPGIGKTQLGIQLALNVQIPEVFSGNAGEAIYIDTEGSFMAERAAEMANELSTHLRKIATASENRKVINAAAQRFAAEATSMER